MLRVADHAGLKLLIGRPDKHYGIAVPEITVSEAILVGLCSVGVAHEGIGGILVPRRSKSSQCPTKSHLKNEAGT